MEIFSSRSDVLLTITKQVICTSWEGRVHAADTCTDNEKRPTESVQNYFLSLRNLQIWDVLVVVVVLIV